MARLNSKFQLKYPINFVKGETHKVELVCGEAYIDVSSRTNHKGSNFKVINQTQEIEVLGTEFNIKAYKAEPNIYTTLVEGKVLIKSSIQHQELKPDQQIILNLEKSIMSVL